jgi:putative transposase
MAAAEQLGSTVGLKRACHSLGIARGTLYRHRARAVQPAAEVASPPPPPLKLDEQERQAVLELLHSPRFVDASPHSVYATVLGEGRYLCSVRTMYRLLDEAGEVRERRNQLRHPQYAKPELLATGSNQLWSWDITKLKGPAKWTYFFYLYVILDVFSRYVVGWMVATRESAALAEKLIRETCTKQGIVRGQLTVHADRGSSMKSKAVAFLLADLGVTKTHSRPHVSNDNPFSEAQFKTLKYRPEFPQRFGSLEDARMHCRGFFRWYNSKHRHSGIAFMTPEDIHYGRAAEIIKVRSQALNSAYEANPARFKGKQPKPSRPPEAVWINPPVDASTDEQEVA